MIALLHVSDLHFGPKHLAGPAEGVLELARRARPAAVVVSGDFTQRAKGRQFDQAKAWLARLAAPVAFVPGNHDVPLYRVWERLFAPFGIWRRRFAAELVREHAAPGLAIFGLNTAFAWTTKHGRVEPRELAGLAARLAAAPPGAFRVLVAHHPLAAAPELGDEPCARRGDEALALCRRAGVELVLSGHLHHSFVTRAADGPLVVHAGTTTSSRGRCGEAGLNSLHWIEVEPNAVRVERRLWDAAAGEFRAEAAREFARGTAALAAAQVS